MEHAEARELTAAYALDALDELEERAYEGHLRSCPECREELTAFTETATSLAYAVDAPAPPRELRERIVQQARAERPKVVPLRPRRSLMFATSGLAAAAATVAIALGLWASSLSDALERERSAVAVLAASDARLIRLNGAAGRLAVRPTGDAAMVLNDLPRAPDGKTYEVWVDAGEGPPRPAGLFQAGEERVVVQITERVSPGTHVMVTFEPEGGRPVPSGPPVFSARA